MQPFAVKAADDNDRSLDLADEALDRTEPGRGCSPQGCYASLSGQLCGRFDIVRA